MQSPEPKYRVSVEFPERERDILQALCDMDLRPASEQIRRLILTEAKRRGLCLQTAIANVEAAYAAANQ
jgi:hypothetical protein